MTTRPPHPDPAWLHRAVAAFELPGDRYRFGPSLAWLEEVHDGDPAGYTPPVPVPLPFYRCRSCGEGGGVRWLRSRFSPTELAACHLVSVELVHVFDCQGCGGAFEHLQLT